MYGVFIDGKGQGFGGGLYVVINDGFDVPGVGAFGEDDVGNVEGVWGEGGCVVRRAVADNDEAVLAGIAFGGAPPAEAWGGDVEGFTISRADVVGGLGTCFWELHVKPRLILGLC